MKSCTAELQLLLEDFRPKKWIFYASLQNKIIENEWIWKNFNLF